VARQGEREADGRVDVGTGDIADGVDHHHDHQAEADRDTDMAECAGFRVDHDRATAGDHEPERPDHLRRECPSQLAIH
jgi:hypothetical protein